MAETNSERDAAQTEVERLNALHTEKSALSAQLTSEINTLSAAKCTSQVQLPDGWLVAAARRSEEVKQLYKELNEASELRDAEKAENQETLERAEAGRASVANAIDILNSSPLPRGEVRSTSLCVGSNQVRGTLPLRIGASAAASAGHRYDAPFHT